jgi:catalase
MKPSSKKRPLPDTDYHDREELLTSNTGAVQDSDLNSLKAGAAGPTLLEDHYLREKITHFDHERIPER